MKRSVIKDRKKMTASAARIFDSRDSDFSDVISGTPQNEDADRLYFPACVVASFRAFILKI